MASRTSLFLLIILSISAMATAAASSNSTMYTAAMIEADGHGLVGDVIDEADEMMFDSDIARRQLGHAGYLSYGALSRNNVPCGKRGRSYYNCRGHERANPYTRGCTRATACARTTR